jgi:hypothetical protein
MHAPTLRLPSLLGCLTLAGCSSPVEEVPLTAALQSAEQPELVNEEAVSPSASPSRTIYSFVSDETWLTASGSMSMPVCLNSTTPATCPKTGSVLLYNYSGSGWAANVAGLPGAKWIWDAGHVTNATSAEGDEISVVKLLPLPACPNGVLGLIYVAADDFAEVWVNGVLAGTVGSTTDPNEAAKAQNNLTAFNLAPYLYPSVHNVLQVRAVNGQCAGCNYSSNPAGMVFGGFLGCR